MSIVMAPNLTASDGTTSKFGLGTVYNTKGATYTYLKAGAAISQYAACTVSNVWVALEGTTTTSGAKPTQVAIPQFEVASGEYFWAPTGPFFLREDGATAFYVLAAQDCATSVKLYTTATDGVVDDSATDLIQGLCLTETITTARAATCIAVQGLVTNCQD
jgi:hypothetical protein